MHRVAEFNNEFADAEKMEDVLPKFSLDHINPYRFIT